MPSLTEEELRDLCAVWQQRLRLQDWDIEVDVKRGNAMQLEDTAACVRWDREWARASIEIRSELDWPPDTLNGAQDMECSLVHELLHVRLALDTPEGDAKYVFEQGIDRIAEALVRAWRKWDHKQ